MKVIIKQNMDRILLTGVPKEKIPEVMEVFDYLSSKDDCSIKIEKEEESEI